MTNLLIRNYATADEAELIGLWRECGLVVPWNDPCADIARKCADSPGLFFVGEIDERIAASCMAGYDGHRGWIYYLAVAPRWQRRGLASQIVSHAEAALAALGCPKIDLMVRNSNHSVQAFYKSIGYGEDPVTVLSKRLIVDA